MNIPLGFIYALVQRLPLPPVIQDPPLDSRSPKQDRSSPPGYLSPWYLTRNRKLHQRESSRVPLCLPAHLRSSHSPGPCFPSPGPCFPSPPSCPQASFSSFMELISDMLVFSVSAPFPSPSHDQPTAKRQLKPE